MDLSRLEPAALAPTALVHDPAPFARIVVRGPDAGAFLHGLCSQDVNGLAVAAAAPAALLTAKGRLESLVTIGRVAGDRFVVETQAHERARVAELIERYHFSERLAIDAGADGERCAQVVGADAWQRAGIGGPGCGLDGDVAWLAGGRRGLQWVRWHGGPMPASLAGLAQLDDAGWQRLRIAAGLAWVGVDAGAANLALEADIDDAVSLSKGCYTGQEIVARIHTYGHLNRRLCRLWIEAVGEVAPGSTVVDGDGEPVGRVTSAAAVDGGCLALGYLPRELWDGGTELRLATAAAAAVHVVGD